MLLGITILCSCSNTNNKNISVKLTKEKFKAHYIITSGDEASTKSVILYKGECASDVIIPEKVICDNVEYTVTSIGIGSSVFKDCTGLTSITIPASVTSIESSAFADCTGLTSITIPNSVMGIGNGAFSGCTGLTSVDIPNSVTSIGAFAFNRCTRLTSITIPNSVTSIGERAFEYCTGLTSITIPNSVTSIESSAFADCTGLTTVTIQDGVTRIGNFTFYDCTGLTSVDIPNSVTRIGYGAFKYCTGLTSVVIPNSVTFIGDGAFEDCSNLTPECAKEVNKRIAELNKRIAALRFDIVMEYPKSVSGVRGYAGGSPAIQWEWTTTFSAKGGKGGFELNSNTYTIEKDGNTGAPRWNTDNHSVSVEKGKSGSITTTFYGVEYLGGVFVRDLRGEDEYGNRIHLTERVRLE